MTPPSCVPFLPYLSALYVFSLLDLSMGWKGGRVREGRGKEEEAGRLSMRARFRAPAILSSISSFIYYSIVSPFLPFSSLYLLSLRIIAKVQWSRVPVLRKEGRGEGTHFENLFTSFSPPFRLFLRSVGM